jgi:protease-4
MRAFIEHAYQQFIEIVAESRHMALEAVDAVSGGRVWTGRQALAHGLIDELGDLKAAVDKARALADLPESTPVALFRGKTNALVPQLAEQANPAAALRYVQENLRSFSGSVQALMPFEWR